MVSQQHECTSIFGIPQSEIYVLPDENVNRVLCQQYSGFPFEYGETVNFVFLVPYKPYIIVLTTLQLQNNTTGTLVSLSGLKEQPRKLLFRYGI